MKNLIAGSLILIIALLFTFCSSEAGPADGGNQNGIKASNFYPGNIGSKFIFRQ